MKVVLVFLVVCGVACQAYLPQQPRLPKPSEISIDVSGAKESLGKLFGIAKGVLGKVTGNKRSLAGSDVQEKVQQLIEAGKTALDNAKAAAEQALETTKPDVEKVLSQAKEVAQAIQSQVREDIKKLFGKAKQIGQKLRPQQQPQN